MGFLASMFDSSKGAGFQAGAANQTNAVNKAQVDQANAQAQGGIGQQQSFVNALQAQNGIGNQSSVFGQQQGLANQLAERAAGGGPNPALAQLQQTTGQNVANQAALMASQRGAGANAGLLARQAAMQGAATQQQAVGQGAQMQAQQQIAAQQALQQQQGMMGSLAGQQVSQQAGAIGGLNQAIQGNQSNMLGAVNNQNQNAIAMQSNQNNANAGIAGANLKAQSDLVGGLLKGASSAAMMGAAHGGMIRGYADGGMTAPSPMSTGAPAAPSSGPSSFAAKYLQAAGKNTASDLEQGSESFGALAGMGLSKGVGALKDAFSSNSVDRAGMGAALNGPNQGPNLGVLGVDYGKSAGPSLMGDMKLSRGGKVPAMLSPGERYIPPSKVAEVASGNEDVRAAGKEVPGKPKVSGDSLKNDTVPASLEEGGVVIPRSVMNSKDPAGSAAKFVAAVLAKQNRGSR